MVKKYLESSDCDIRSDITAAVFCMEQGIPARYNLSFVYGIWL